MLTFDSKILRWRDQMGQFASPPKQEGGNMLIRVDRIVSNHDVTISRVYIDGVFQCHGCEDEYREHKIPGETRIPQGTYKIGIRAEGGFHNRYSQKFPDFHRGMLHVLNVPDFKWILIHVGNYDTDTDGCLLLGRADFNAMAVWQSKAAYTKFYKKVIGEALAGRVTIEFRDLDR